MSFYIKKVTVTGRDKEPATISFSRGLNIICGVSDTGKTGILKTISYFWNGEKPFDAESTGYDHAKIDIGTDRGTISLERDFKKRSRTIILVKSNDPSIQDGEYDTEYKKGGNNNPVINELWLKLIGIPNLPMIPWNKNFERKRLTWNVLSHLFLLQEDNMVRKTSIYQPEIYDITYFIACLLFLLTNDDFSDEQTREKDALTAAKKQALKSFVSAQIQGMSERSKEIRHKLSEFDSVDYVATIEEQKILLEKAESALKSAIETSQDLLSNLLLQQEKLGNAQLTLNQFKDLESQYLADIKRLTFIVEGGTHLQHNHTITICPVCDSKVEIENESTYIEASKAELSRILMQLDGLTASKKDVHSELNDSKAKIKFLEEQRATINFTIESDLAPHAKTLKTTIERYQEGIELQNELNVIKQMSQTWNDNLEEEIKAPPKQVDFSPKKNFPSNFVRDLNAIVTRILEEAQYENFNHATFNLRSFDIEINGKKKSTHGKGYVAFINSVFALMFREYIQDISAHKVGFLALDTPLLGLDQGDDTPESMKYGLFNYLLNHQHNGQVIVIENTNSLPDLPYEERGAKVVEFTHDKYQSRFSESRYGFLHGVYES
ncbi:hypothetical protein [Enterococcus gallinarum]|uniref:hypothetical protein n=1 Tax=Enterococcus gallinarum TaxID=1353 RepID=UPI001BCC8943|nr:hypothetical protein [Enterococcus gallinarum]